MIVTVTFKCAPSPGHHLGFPGEYAEFRKRIEKHQAAGLLFPLDTQFRWLIEGAYGQSAPTSTENPEPMSV